MSSSKIKLNDLLLDCEIQKKYDEETGKHSIWSKKPTNEFKKWVRENIKLLKPFIEKMKSKKSSFINAENFTTIDKSSEINDTFINGELGNNNEKNNNLEKEKKKIIISTKPKENESSKKEEDVSSSKNINSNIKSAPLNEKSVSSIPLSKKIGYKKLSPVIFNATYDDTWQPLIKAGQEEVEQGLLYRKHIIMIIGGETGVGKTHLCLDMVKSPQIEVAGYIIPAGKPIYVIYFDKSVYNEIIMKYKSYIWKDIFPVYCRVLDDVTGKTDYIASLAKANKFLSGLREVDQGTVYINWTKYCVFVLISYMLTSGGKKSKGINLNEFLRPEIPLSPTEHQYKAGLLFDTLLSFQDDYKIHFMLETNIKPETVNAGDSVYDFERTGKMVEDMQKGSDNMVDIVVRMYKEKVGEKIYRKLMVTKSRFEGEVIDVNGIVLTSPSAAKLMKSIINLYLKSKK